MARVYTVHTTADTVTYTPIRQYTEYYIFYVRKLCYQPITFKTEIKLVQNPI